jgi:hypothetical protein
MSNDLASNFQLPTFTVVVVACHEESTQKKIVHNKCRKCAKCKKKLCTINVESAQKKTKLVR